MDQARAAAAEIGAAAGGTDPAGFAALARAIVAARRIVTHGVGREGLMMRALAMRLFHLGLDVHVAGDMTVPPIGPGDLLIVSAGPGDLPTVAALVQVALATGVQVACVTAQPSGPVPAMAAIVLHIPAQTMADDLGAAPAVLPMGSVFEGAMFIVFELLVLRVMALTGQSPDDLRARHTNLE
jgi:6-phospho-3-hexuloisomerase